MYDSFAKMLVRLGKRLWSVLLRNWLIGMPMFACPSVITCPALEYHFSIPSRSKMSSWLETCAGVRRFHFLFSSCRSVCGWDSDPTAPLKVRNKRAGSEPRSVEKRIFARWRLSVVICTERTAR